jgi:hypothetical protein
MNAASITNIVTLPRLALEFFLPTFARIAIAAAEVTRAVLEISSSTETAKYDSARMPDANAAASWARGYKAKAPGREWVTDSCAKVCPGINPDSGR